ncbi:hypothetical protein [Pantoea piersonii]|uniref:hypothetical protein n=1 Tax=Pantoea piersonii TaxID=2364647 RepID=UPI0028A24D2C|nr:hypothetical protein [Pantoea piersonii]
MKIFDDKEATASIAPFATTCGAASYKTNGGEYVDLFFLRAFFSLEGGRPSKNQDDPDFQHQEADLKLAKVASVTIPAEQAKELIKAIEHQLKLLKGM